MKLLIAADIFPPQAGGPATYAVSLANALVKEGIDVSIVSLNRESDRSIVSCILYLVSCKNKLARYIQYFYLLYKHAKHTDVIYAMGPMNAGLPSLIVSRLRRKKCVVKVVGDYAWEQYQNAKCKMQNAKLNSIDDFQKRWRYGLKIMLLRLIERCVVQRAEAVIVPSEYLKKMVIGWGAREDRVAVIYNAVSLPERLIAKQKPAGEQWIVSVGRFVPWKGFETLIELMPRLLKQFSSLHLKLIGDGPNFENLKSIRRLADKSQELENAVAFLGSLSHDETLSYIAAADVFVLNSGYEGLSHVLLEAIQLERPVIASASGGNVELLPKEHLFEYNNKEEIFAKISHFLSHSVSVYKYNIDQNRFSFHTMISNTRSLLEKICRYS